MVQGPLRTSSGSWTPCRPSSETYTGLRRSLENTWRHGLSSCPVIWLSPLLNGNKVTPTRNVLDDHITGHLTWTSITMFLKTLQYYIERLKSRPWGHFGFLKVSFFYCNKTALLENVGLKSSFKFFLFLKDQGCIRSQAAENQSSHRLPRSSVDLHHVQCDGRCESPVS